MKNKLLLLIVTLLMATSNFYAQSKKEIKQQEKLEQYRAMKKLVENGKLKFEANTAFTQSGRRIDLVTNPNSLVLNGKTSEVEMPYYGTVHIVSYDNNGGINFKNEATEYSIKYDDKKLKIIIKFSANNKTEKFNLTLTISGDNFATLNITSSHRSLINYNGHVKALIDEDE